MPSFLVLLLAGFTPAFGQDSGFSVVDEWPNAAGKKGVPEGWTLKELVLWYHLYLYWVRLWLYRCRWQENNRTSGNHRWLHRQRVGRNLY
ncbi:MAG: hypothetical protein QGG90_13520, partial [Nitrospinota bacterium]|nr:hypothetical protein [Nitrospinota bacterium]